MWVNNEATIVRVASSLNEKEISLRNENNDLYIYYRQLAITLAENGLFAEARRAAYSTPGSLEMMRISSEIVAIEKQKQKT